MGWRGEVIVRTTAELEREKEEDVGDPRGGGR